MLAGPIVVAIFDEEEILYGYWRHHTEGRNEDLRLQILHVYLPVHSPVYRRVTEPKKTIY
jgi:hypothetical protein